MRLGLQRQLRLGERPDLLGEGAVGERAGFLQFTHPDVDLLERLTQRPDEVVDLACPRLQLAPRQLMLMTERIARELQEHLVVPRERVGRQRPKTIGELPLRVLEQSELFGCTGALVLQLRAQRAQLHARVAQIALHVRQPYVALADGALELAHPYAVRASHHDLRARPEKHECASERSAERDPDGGHVQRLLRRGRAAAHLFASGARAGTVDEVGLSHELGGWRESATLRRRLLRERALYRVVLRAGVPEYPVIEPDIIDGADLSAGLVDAVWKVAVDPRRIERLQPGDHSRRRHAGLFQPLPADHAEADRGEYGLVRHAVRPRYTLQMCREIM